MDGLLTESHETDVDCGGVYCQPCLSGEVRLLTPPFPIVTVYKHSQHACRSIEFCWKFFCSSGVLFRSLLHYLALFHSAVGKILTARETLCVSTLTSCPQNSTTSHLTTLWPTHAVHLPQSPPNQSSL